LIKKNEKSGKLGKVTTLAKLQPKKKRKKSKGENTKMAKTNFSRHMKVDRLDRYAMIATKVGFGEVLYSSTYSDKDGRWQNRTVELTSTGVCIVKAENGTIVTMYCVTLALAKSYFKLEKMPRELFAAIRLNERKGYCNL
jgi:hypothetical protein